MPYSGVIKWYNALFLLAHSSTFYLYPIIPKESDNRPNFSTYFYLYTWREQITLSRVFDNHRVHSSCSYWHK